MNGRTKEVYQTVLRVESNQIYLKYYIQDTNILITDRNNLDE